MSASRRQQKKKPLLTGFQGLLSIVVLIVAIGLLLYQLFSSILVAFSQSYWIGIRGLAAALFPLSIAIYLGFLARMQVPTNKEGRAPIINNFILFILWTMMLFGLDGSNGLDQFPLEELLYSITLSILIWRYKRRNSMKDLLACCYGIVSGSMAALILFGWNPVGM